MKRCAASALILLWLSLMAGSAGAAETSISVQDNFYQPAYRVIFVGDTVNWHVDGSQPHTVTAFDGSFDSSNNDNPTGQGSCQGTLLNPDNCLRHGDDYSHPFTAAGTFRYYCKAHGTKEVAPDPSKAAQAQPCGMCGVIVVRERTTARPTSLASETHRATSSPKTSARPTATTSAGATPSAGSTPTTTSEPAASKDHGSAGRLGLALLAISILSGAAYATWRRFIAPSR